MHLYRHGAGLTYAADTVREFTIAAHSYLRGRVAAKFRFAYFGNGLDRTSEFHTYVEFEEVRGLLQGFADAGHPEAVKMVEDLALASQVRALVNPPAPVRSDSLAAVP